MLEKTNGLAMLVVAIFACSGCSDGTETDRQYDVEERRVVTDWPEPRFDLAGITHKVVCRCTCKSDNTPDENVETHALPSSGDCETLNLVQCETAGPPPILGTLRDCYKRSIAVDD